MGSQGENMDGGTLQAGDRSPCGVRSATLLSCHSASIKMPLWTSQGEVSLEARLPSAPCPLRGHGNSVPLHTEHPQLLGV